MIYRIKITDHAKSDLIEILDYITNTLFAPKAAIELKSAFKESFEILKTSPRVYTECNDKRLAHNGYRKAIVKNYIGLYKVDDEQKVVTIMRIVYAKMDYAKLV